VATPEFTFKSAAYAAGTFTVVDFQGTEAISNLYQFNIGLKCTAAVGPGINLETLLAAGATLSLETGEGGAANNYSGMLAWAEQQQVAGGFYYYRVLLVPPAWRLSLNRTTAGFVGSAHPTIVQTVLTNGDITAAGGELDVTGIIGKIEPTILNLRSTTSDQETSQTTPAGVTQSLDSDDYVYPSYDFTCQYAESDLDFVCRLLEYNGIYFYFFEEPNGACKMTLADGAAYPHLSVGPSSIPFTDPSSTNNYECIVQITQQLAAATTKVSVTGHDYLHPGTAASVAYGVSVDGKALTQTYPTGWLYDNRVQTQAEAGHIAMVRAQELSAAACVYTGSGAVCTLRAGFAFGLTGHPVQSFNQPYLITGVQHSARNLDQSWTTASYTAAQSATTGAYYSNSFTAIPAHVQFRPQRMTPKPCIAGVLSAMVYVPPDDGSGQGGQAARAPQGGPQGGQVKSNTPNNQTNQSIQAEQVAQVGPPGYNSANAKNAPSGFNLPAAPVDDQGRYLVYLPFADGAVPGSTVVTAWVRMAQPSAGLYTGTQYTLEPGAEVLLAFVGGDPDLPVIVGSVYNGAIVAPLTSASTDPQI